MIQVQGLTKRYGLFEAIRDVSFSIGKGEVVGFLGPNGAGKSTTMRILCGCIGATSGNAMIDGKDVQLHPKEIKRRIGYLPENPPLYTGMSVQDYIRFAAEIKGVQDTNRAVEQVIGKVGLQEVQNRIIDHLSKGFRQRVGLAQALVHDPDVLVLDEPTSGLDPAQRKEIRGLLQELAEGQRTVVLSTHVLGEVEALCKRLLVISGGEIVAEDSLEALQNKANRISMRVARPEDSLLEELLSIPAVTKASPGEGGLYELSMEGDAREQISNAAVGYGLLQLTPSSSLEDIYLRLTQGGGE
jgi:ABC-2 type transport system ATP-binding protein